MMTISLKKNRLPVAFATAAALVFESQAAQAATYTYDFKSAANSGGGIGE